MLKLKNSLTDTFITGKQESFLIDCISLTSRYYRAYDPGQYLYNLVCSFNGDKFSQKFIELVYTTLIAWNMNHRGAKLSEFNLFRDSILEHKEKVLSLSNFRLEGSDNVDQIESLLANLFNGLCLVSDGKPKLVTFSKTLHYFLPDLLMPIDRRYTIQFYRGYTGIPETKQGQFDLYKLILEDFRQFAHSLNLSIYQDDKWNKNVPKIIDNLIISYTNKYLLKSNEGLENPANDI